MWGRRSSRLLSRQRPVALSALIESLRAARARGSGEAVQQLKRESGKGLFVGGVKLPLTLAELGLIDEFDFVVQPSLAGQGPALFAGLSKRIDLRFVGRLEFSSGAVGMRYEASARPELGHDVCASAVWSCRIMSTSRSSKANASGKHGFTMNRSHPAASACCLTDSGA